MRIKVVNIETERLLLRKFNETDANDYAEFMSDKHMWDFQHDHDQTKEDYLKAFPAFVSGYRKRKYPNMNFAVELKKNHKVIGIIILGVAWKDDLCKLGWGLNSKFWHKGYAYEACKAIVDYLFDNYNFHRIEVNVWQGNTASENLALRLGFKKEGIERESRKKQNKYLDSYNYGLLRSEWEGK